MKLATEKQKKFIEKLLKEVKKINNKYELLPFKSSVQASRRIETLLKILKRNKIPGVNNNKIIKSRPNIIKENSHKKNYLSPEDDSDFASCFDWGSQ
jgi:hypothetical protein